MTQKENSTIFTEKNIESQMRRKRAGKRRKLRRIRKVLLATGLILVLVAIVFGVLNLQAVTLTSQLARQGYPDSLISLLQRNPETKEFVIDYMANKDAHAQIDLSGEVVQGEIPLFLQWDERWGYEIYGDDFLAVTGCGPTCLSMVLCGLSGSTEWNPYAVACWAQEQGYYVEDSGSSWSLMSTGAETLDLTVIYVSYDADSILNALQSGIPIICAMGPGDFTTSGHFIVLTGVDKDGQVIVNDPNSKINSEKTWEIDTLIPQMRNLWGYSWQ